MVDALRVTYDRVLEYMAGELPDDQVLAWVLRETEARGIPGIQITPVVGRLLQLLARLVNGRRILEIGTLSGYSGLWMARALPPDGRLITLEVNARHAELAREAFRRAGVANRVDLRLGPALETLATLRLDGPLDMAFIDADKGNNWNYFQWAYPRVRGGGIVVIDNVLVNGQVATPHPAGSYARSVAELNRSILERYEDATTIVPYYRPDEDNLDGLMIVRVP